MTKIKLVNAEVFKLEAGKKYIIGLDTRMVSNTDAQLLFHELNQMGIKDCVVMAFRGDPKNGMKVIEQ